MVFIEAIGRSFLFEPWEPLHTEYSYKYLASDIDRLAEETGFEVKQHIYDSRNYFADSVWRVQKVGSGVTRESRPESDGKGKVERGVDHSAPIKHLPRAWRERRALCRQRLKNTTESSLARARVEIRWLWHSLPQVGRWLWLSASIWAGPASITVALQPKQWWRAGEWPTLPGERRTTGYRVGKIEMDMVKVRERKRAIVQNFRQGSERRIRETPGL